MTSKVAVAESGDLLGLTDVQYADATCECGYVSREYLDHHVCPQCEAAEADHG